MVGGGGLCSETSGLRIVGARRINQRATSCLVHTLYKAQRSVKSREEKPDFRPRPVDTESIDVYPPTHDP